MKPCIQLSEIPREQWHLKASLWNFRKRRKEAKPCKYSYAIHKDRLVQMPRSEDFWIKTFELISLSEYCSSSYGGYFAAPAKQQDLKGTGMARTGTNTLGSTEINKQINKHQVYASHNEHNNAIEVSFIRHPLKDFLWINAISWMKFSGDRAVQYFQMLCYQRTSGTK